VARCISEESLRKAIESFVGSYDQLPPMYSALKVNGKKLYELARAGIEVERKARSVKILAINILEVNMEEARVKFEVECSKGTYIRTLCHDIGEKLGCGAAMESLERTKAAGLTKTSAITLSELERIVKEEKVDSILISIDKMFESYPKASAKVGFEKLLYNGNSIPEEGVNLSGNTDKNDLKKVDKVRMYDDKDDFIGIYSYDNKYQLFKLEKMFYDAVH
nr:tRNA pseudouridine(55) synthase [Parasporobacterium sp.]